MSSLGGLVATLPSLDCSLVVASFPDARTPNTTPTATAAPITSPNANVSTMMSLDRRDKVPSVDVCASFPSFPLDGGVAEATIPVVAANISLDWPLTASSPNSVVASSNVSSIFSSFAGSAWVSPVW